MTFLPLANPEALRGIRTIPVYGSWERGRDEYVMDYHAMYVECHPFAAAELAAYAQPVDYSTPARDRRPDVDVWLEGVEWAVRERAGRQFLNLMLALTEANIRERIRVMVEEHEALRG